MPSVEAKMFEIMSRATSPVSGILTLVPASRIKVPGAWQGLVLPYIIHFPVAVQPVHTHEKLVSLRIWRFYQISIFANSASEAIAVRDAVIVTLDGYRDADVNRIAYLGAGGAGDFDTDAGVQFLPLNFEVSGAMTG